MLPTGLPYFGRKKLRCYDFAMSAAKSLKPEKLLPPLTEQPMSSFAQQFCYSRKRTEIEEEPLIRRANRGRKYLWACCYSSTWQEF